MNIREVIEEIKLPSKGAPYYSYTSVDGYAWLATAKAMLGLDYSAELKIIMKEEALGLRAPHTMLAVGKRYTSNATYTYSCWPVWELAQVTQLDELIRFVETELSCISIYEGGGIEAGAIEYVSEGCDYLVPNIQALAALMLPQHRTSLLEWLTQNQNDDGNWYYRIISTQEKKSKEDVFHLAFITYALRQLEYRGSTLDKVLRYIYKETLTAIPAGSIGWGPPMVLRAICGLQDELEQRAITASERLLQDKDANFRARAFAAWALACRKCV